jgi:hypothetical protein
LTSSSNPKTIPKTIRTVDTTRTDNHKAIVSTHGWVWYKIVFGRNKLFILHIIKILIWINGKLFYFIFFLFFVIIFFFTFRNRCGTWSITRTRSPDTGVPCYYARNQIRTLIVSNLTRSNVCLRLLNLNSRGNQIHVKHLSAFCTFKIWRSTVVQKW